MNLKFQRLDQQLPISSVIVFREPCLDPKRYIDRPSSGHHECCESSIGIETNGRRHLCLGGLGGLLHLFLPPMILSRHSQCRLDDLSISLFKIRQAVNLKPLKLQIHPHQSCHFHYHVMNFSKHHELPKGGKKKIE